MRFIVVTSSSSAGAYSSTVGTASGSRSITWLTISMRRCLRGVSIWNR